MAVRVGSWPEAQPPYLSQWVNSRETNGGMDAFRNTQSTTHTLTPNRLAGREESVGYVTH
jgi:hypothetical protein